MCPCGATIVAAEMETVSEHEGTDSPTQQQLPQPPNTPEYKKEAAALRKRITEAMRAKSAYKKAIVDAKRSFKEQIHGELLAIRNAKKAAITALKASPAARAMRAKKAAATAAATRLRKKYKFKRRQMWDLFPRLRDRSRWRSGIPHILWRAFRVRL